ncbi:MAG: GNAT family N-acetyltransferase, partial [Corynebacterium sp.]|nr:GNAT family N-acetyltransferase [Corynebacterium sp.]
MSLTIRRLSPQEFALNAQPLVDIYISAMGYDPAIRDGRVYSWQREIIRPGFTAL